MKRIYLKLILALIIAFSLFLLSNSKVFAAEYPVTFCGVTENITIPDNDLTRNAHWLIHICSFSSDSENGYNYSVWFVCSSSKLVYTGWSEEKRQHYFGITEGHWSSVSISGGASTVSQWFTRLQSSIDGIFETKTYEGLINNSTNPNYIFSLSYANYEKRVAVLTNRDVTTPSGFTTFFQKAPPLGAIVADSITSIRCSAVLQEVLALLPILLIVLIGLVTLMKAIKLLFSIFRNA